MLRHVVDGVEKIRSGVYEAHEAARLIEFLRAVAEVQARRFSGGAGITGNRYLLPRLHSVALLHLDFGEVEVHGLESIGVIDADESAAYRILGGFGDPAFKRCVNRHGPAAGNLPRAKVHAIVPARGSDRRVVCRSLTKPLGAYELVERLRQTAVGARRKYVAFRRHRT